MHSLSDQQAQDLLQLVRYKVWAFTRGRMTDTEDLVSEVVVSVLERLPDFDAARARLDTYQNRLIDHACTNCFRRRNAAKRGGARKPVSFRRQDQVVDGQQHRAAGVKRNGTPCFQSDLRMDLQAATEALNPDQQQLCEKIKHRSVVEIAEQEHVVRGTIYRRLRPVRRVFENLRLAEYLE
jgi:RNA polymerase sigma factor (sigma-70 family)